MKGIYVWVETSKQGTHLVRYENAQGRHNKYAVEPAQEAFIDGQRYVGRTLAKKLAADLKAELKRGHVGGQDLKAAIEPLVVEWINNDRSNNFSISTLLHHKNSLDSFVRGTGLVLVSEIDRDKIVAWKLAMIKAGDANETIRGRLADVRRFLNHLVEIKKIGANPFGTGVMPKKKDAEPKYYTTSEFLDLCTQMKDISAAGLIAINLAHDCGLRKIEMVGDGHGRGGVLHEDITWLPGGNADLHMRREVVKGAAVPRTVPLTAGMIELFGSRKTGPLINLTRFQLDHFFQSARKKAGINPELDIHGLRHTFAKNQLQRGNVNLAGLKELLGHKSIVSTQIYAQFEKSHLREVIDRAYEQRIQAEALVQKMQVVG